MCFTDDVFGTAVSIWRTKKTLARKFRCNSCKAQLKYMVMTQRRSETHSTSPCQYGLDLSRRRRMTTALWHYEKISPTGNQLFAKQSGMSRQRILTHQRSASTGTSLCITIRFVLLPTTIFHSEKNCQLLKSFSLRYSLSYQQSVFCKI